MSDYTLPPLPIACEGWSVPAQSELRTYGHACAEAARAPLLARIAELEADNKLLTRECADAEDESGRLEEELQKAHDENDRLRAEVEALRAASVIEWEPGRSYTAAELLRRVISNTTPRKGDMLFPSVMKLCGVGSTVACYLCRWAGRDPETGKAIAARKGEGVAGA